MKITIPAILIYIFLIFLMPGHAQASDITEADYYGTIIISNNGTAATYVSTNMSLSSASMISNSYVDGDMYGAAILTNGGSDALFMPGYGSNPWWIYVPSISANSSINYSLYFSSTDNLSATKYYFPGDSGMTVTDVAGLEIGNKAFSLTVQGYFDLSADGENGHIVFKDQSLYFRCGATNQINCSMYGVASFTVPGISSGFHKMRFYRETTGSGNITLEVDDVYANSVAVGAGGFPDNANDWEFFKNNTANTTAVIMHYADFVIDGSQVGHWEWEYGTTFTDQSGNGHTGTPSYMTTQIDNVTAILSSFEPINPAQAPAYTVEDAPDFITGNITATGNFTTSSLPDASFPVADVIEDVSSESETPEIWMWGILAMMGIGISGIGISYARKKFGIGGGYVLGVTVIALLVFGILVTFGKFNWWMIWFYIIIAGGIAVASRHIDWGGATSQHGLIGFLAMSWVGMTLINRILEGSLITSSETAFLNTVSFTRAFDVLGMFTLPILNFSFFTQGIPSLMRWDYSYFGGQAQIIQYMLYSITAVVSFIIFGLVLGLVYNYFSRLR